MASLSGSLAGSGGGACRSVGCRGFPRGRGSQARVLMGGGSGAECSLLGWPVFQARTQLPLLSRRPRFRSLRRFSPATRSSQALFRLMPRWGVSGHEKLPTGGQSGARWRPRGLPGHGHQRCPPTASRNTVCEGRKPPNSAPPPPSDDSSEYSGWGGREGLGCVSQLAWLHRTHGARDMPVCDSGMLPDSDRKCWSESTDGWNSRGISRRHKQTSELRYERQLHGRPCRLEGFGR